MRLSAAQDTMLTRMDVRKGKFWPSGGPEWTTYYALKCRGLMHHREWILDDEVTTRTCKALTKTGMELLVRLLDVEGRRDGKDGLGSGA